MKPWQGKSVWIWDLDKCEGGNVNTILTKARAAKVDALIVKAHDGAAWWDQFTPELIQQLHGYDIKVGAWGYCYGEHWQTEAQNAVKALNMGADFYVADVEVEFEKTSMADVATQLMSAIRNGGNKTKPIGFTSFGIPDYHPSFPWKAFAALADFFAKCTGATSAWMQAKRRGWPSHNPKRLAFPSFRKARRTTT